MAEPRTSRRYPDAERLRLTETRHGIRVSDPYRWLEDRTDPRTAAWLSAQEELLVAERARWPTEEWRVSVASLEAGDMSSPPVRRREKSFVLRQRPSDEHPILYVEENGDVRQLIDPMRLDPSGRTVLDAWRPSVEGDLLAYQISVDGTEDASFWILDVATGQVVDGPIGRVRRSPTAWLPGGTHFYYVRRLAPELHPGEEQYHRRVYLHRVGADPDRDVLVFGDGGDKTRFYSVDVTADGRWLTITATTGTDPSTDIWLADLAASPWHAPVLRPVQENVAARTTIHIAHGTGPADPIWLRTTLGTSYGRIMTATPAGASTAWRELIAERPGAVLVDFAPLTGAHLPRPLALVVWTRHMVSEITVHELESGTEVGTVPLPGTGSVTNVLVPREGGHEAWFAYTDHATPPTVLHYDARTGVTRRWSPGDAATGGSGVHVGQVAFASRDGTEIRMFVLSPEGRPDRPRPAILTGYGGFGVSMTPSYSPQALSWARAGGVFAIACLRGGGEEGEQWHHAGRQANKQNVFDDFDAATDYLVGTGWTTTGQLGIMGGSNGGLLIGAALTQHPEKYGAAVCLAPVLDMARFELSGLGPSWRLEYGTADDPDEFRVLLSYSPYHRVDPGRRYPPVLFTVADGDSRVDPLHARKMCAALQYASSGPGPVLFHGVRGVGHAAWARSQAAVVKAECLAFLATHLGLGPRGAPA